MLVNQLSVFMENKEGRLEQVLETLAEGNININSLSLAEATDYGMLRMIVSDPEAGKAALKEKGLEINSEKEFYYAPGDEIEFLGFSYKNGTIDLNKNSIRKIKSKIRNLHEIFKNPQNKQGFFL